MMSKIIEIEEKKLIDFLNFKIKNELTFCTFQSADIFKKETVWKVTRQFTKNFYSTSDIEKIKEELFEIMNENNIIGNITKINCTNNQFTVEFSFYP